MHFALATVVASTASLAFTPFVNTRGPMRVIAWMICLAAVMLSPCLVPQGSLERMASALVMACLLAKLIDLFLGLGVCRQPFLFYVTWLPNPFWLVRRR